MLFYYYKDSYILPTTVKEHYAKADPLQKEMMAPQEEIATVTKSNAAVQTELKAKPEEVATLRETITALQAELKAKQEEIEFLQNSKQLQDRGPERETDDKKCTCRVL